VQGRGAELSLVKKATTISYGAHADELVLTARRGDDSPPSDQVLVVAPKGSYVLSEVGTWDTLGMRGTCSPPAVVTVRGERALLLAQPFARIASESMVPVSHILWSACWLGIAQDAVSRVQALVRAQARSSPSSMPRSARRLPELARKLELVRRSVQMAAREYQGLWDAQDGGQLASVGYALAINNLKLSVSELCVEIVLEAVHAAGIVAYKNDSPHALGRNVRDALSAPLMIGNDRIRETNAALLLVHKGS
jgi:acyl-CoA dehydrogenase